MRDVNAVMRLGRSRSLLPHDDSLISRHPRIMQYIDVIDKNDSIVDNNTKKYEDSQVSHLIQVGARQVKDTGYADQRKLDLVPIKAVSSF